METGDHIIESTAGCMRLPVLAFAAEEVGLDYALQVRPDGYFESNFGTLGPALTLPGEHTVGLDPALVRLAAYFDRSHDERTALDAWIATHVTEIRPAIVGMRRQEPDAGDKLVRALIRLDARLAETGAWLDGQFGVADCLNISLANLPRIGVPLDAWPALQRYVGSLTQREAFLRSSARLQEIR